MGSDWDDRHRWPDDGRKTQARSSNDDALVPLAQQTP